MPTGKEIVELELTQDKKPYIFGYEVDLDDPNPEAFDCSELEEWACWQKKVTPRFPDGSANQLEHCRKHGTLINIAEAIRTPGALLFYQTRSIKHVATSQGNGMMIEARGKDWGVGQWPAEGRGWTHAALIPGVTYETVPILYRLTSPMMQGAVVKQIQKALGIEADGYFGPITKAAVIRFQKTHGLEQDGVVGPITFKAIGI